MNTSSLLYSRKGLRLDDLISFYHLASKVEMRCWRDLDSSSTMIWEDEALVQYIVPKTFLISSYKGIPRVMSQHIPSDEFLLTSRDSGKSPLSYSLQPDTFTRTCNRDQISSLNMSM
jgi:hypothetical protein